MKYTIGRIMQENGAAGKKFFDPYTMLFFGSTIYIDVYEGNGGVYFITSEKQYRDDLPHLFHVRKFDETTASIYTVGEFATGLATLSEAVEIAKRLTGETMPLKYGPDGRDRR
jgi:hypothetical protein